MKECAKDLFKATEKNKLKNDIILILFFCILAFIMCFILYHRASNHNDIMLNITVDGKVVISYEFNKEDNIYKVFPLETGNVVVIKDGQVYMESANCPDGLCMKQGKISLANQSIICLPHKVVVKLTDVLVEDISNGTNDDRLDVMPR